MDVLPLINLKKLKKMLSTLTFQTTYIKTHSKKTLISFLHFSNLLLFSLPLQPNFIIIWAMENRMTVLKDVNYEKVQISPQKIDFFGSFDFFFFRISNSIRP